MVDLVMAADIPSAHPRTPYFRRLADRLIADGVGCQLLLEGDRFAGRRSMTALERGEVDLVWVNAAHLEALAAPLSLLNQPFGPGDVEWARPGRAQALVKWVDSHTVQAGVRTLAVMRGADQLFASARGTISDLDHLQGQRVRVAGAGMYERLMRVLGADPVVMPIPDIPRAFSGARLDQVFTSPGGWQTQLGTEATFATQVPGLMFICYFLLARAPVLEAWPVPAREALAAAARQHVTEAWTPMQQDDVRVLEEARARGAQVRTLEDTAPWRARTQPLQEEAARNHPAAHAALEAVARGA